MTPKRDSIVFMKRYDCITEYEQYYEKKPDQIYDSVEPYIKQIINFSEKNKGYSVSIVSFGVRNSKLTPRKHLELRVLNNAATTKTSKILKFIKNNMLLFIYLTRKKPARIIYLGDLRFLPGPAAYSLLSGSKVYLFLTGSIEKHKILTSIAKFTGERTGMIISINKRNIDILCALGYSGKWELFKPVYGAIQERQIKPTRLREDKFFKVLFVGRLSYVKGIDILQQIVLKAKEKDISFYVIGDGPEFAALSSFKSDNHINNLHLLGFVPNSEIFSFMKDADVGLIPSKSEGICMVALEFMLMQTPVVASDVGGISETITNGVNGFLVDPADAESFLTKIQQLKDSEELLRGLIRGTRGIKESILDYNQDFSYHVEKIIA